MRSWWNLVGYFYYYSGKEAKHMRCLWAASSGKTEHCISASWGWLRGWRVKKIIIWNVFDKICLLVLCSLILKLLFALVVFRNGEMGGVPTKMWFQPQLVLQKLLGKLFQSWMGNLLVWLSVFQYLMSLW